MGAIRDFFTDFSHFQPLLANGARIGFILAAAYICTRISGRLLLGLRTYSVKMMLRSGGVSEFELEKRADTVGGVARKATFVLIWTIAWIMVLRELNFDIRPLLAGAGVVGVAIGFGAQSIVKDVFSGLFLLIENQIRVNDVAVINGKGGLVEEINLRTTVLRSEDGGVHVFPNGNIQTLSNLTRDYSFYVISISIPFKEDTDHVIAVIQEIAAQLAQEEPYRGVILDALDVVGVDQLNDSTVVIKVRFKTLPNKQWMVGREMNRRLKKRFEEANIDLGPPPQAIRLLSGLTPELREELKQVVREVLLESKSA